MENPPVPRHVAQVVADQQAATILLADLFRALSDAAEQAAVYTAVASYDGEGSPELLGPLSVVVLLGAPFSQSRRVVYEGEWLLEDLTAHDPGELRKVYDRLRRAVEGGSP